MAAAVASATAAAVPILAPRPSPRPLAAWSSATHYAMPGKENRPALKQLQHTAPPRPRRERPCDGCRRRKSKCVVQNAPRCVLCAFHNQDCTFIENAQPRKRRLDDASSSSKSDSSPAKRSPATTHPSTPSDSLPPTLQDAILLDAPTVALAPRPAGPVLSVVDQSLSLQRHRHCRYIGQTTALDAGLIALGHFDDNNESESRLGTLRGVAADEYFTTHADADVPIPDDEARALAEIDRLIHPHGPALVDLYFRNVHPSFPIIQKHAFLDRHNRNDRQFNPPLLAAIYLLALTWWSHEPALANHPKPDVARLEYIAITSLTVAMQRPKMSALQAGLLLLQRSKSSTWTLTVQLVALAQDIGLHLDCSHWSIPLWERRLRKRLAWALYMQDKWSALVHGRPSHINPADWNVPAPTMDDFDESILSSGDSSTVFDEREVDQDVLNGRTVFIHLISLTAIMAEVCETFYSQTAKADFARAGRHATQLVLNRAKPVQIKLKHWFARLPAECKLDAPTAAPDRPSPNGHLHLAYFAAEISIHRRIVQSLHDQQHHPASSSTSTSASDPTPAPYMLYICRSAAKTRLISAMDLVNRLRPAHLRAFWFFASAANFALVGTFGALLQATSPAHEEAAFYAARLGEFRWTLAVSARDAPWLRGALDALDANAAMLRRVDRRSGHVRAFDSEVAMNADLRHADGEELLDDGSSAHACVVMKSDDC